MTTWPSDEGSDGLSNPKSSSTIIGARGTPYATARADHRIGGTPGGRWRSHEVGNELLVRTVRSHLYGVRPFDGRVARREESLNIDCGTLSFRKIALDDRADRTVVGSVVEGSSLRKPTTA